MYQLLFAAATLWMSASSGSISGSGSVDQWGNDWVWVNAHGGTALVSVYDCDGTPHIIGEVPIASLGSGDNFNGFKPYRNASDQDLVAVDEQEQFERSCMAQSQTGGACGPIPERRDCIVVERRASNHSTLISQRAYGWWKAVHGNKYP